MLAWWPELSWLIFAVCVSSQLVSLNSPLAVRVLEQLTPLHGKVNSETISTVCNIFDDLQSWYLEWKDIHTENYSHNSSVLTHLLEVELGYAQLWTVCVALRGCQWDKVCYLRNRA